MARPRLIRSAAYASMIRDERLRQGWTQEDLGEQIGHDERYVRRIENEYIVPRASERVPLEKALEIEPERARSVLRQGVNVRYESDKNQQIAMEFSLKSKELYESYLSKIETLDVMTSPKIESISYGEGIQVENITDRLRVLPASTVLPVEYVPYDGRSGHVIKSLFEDDEIVRIGEQYQIFVPHKITIGGRKQIAGNTVAAYLCTDIFYLFGIDPDQNSETFSITGFVGRGGIADFVDPNGIPQNWNQYILGDGAGSVGVLTIVEFSDMQPTERSAYTLVVRKGIRYPDDYWCSAVSGKPFTPIGIQDLTTTRFIFQSRQPNGNSTDVFVADFNGERMCNLTRKDIQRYDGVLDSGGREVARWIDKTTIQYCSLREGARRIIQRRDCISGEKVGEQILGVT